MGKLILVLGGARSGKSGFAQRLAQERGGEAVAYVATAEAKDEEMAARIALHRRSRPTIWQTVEAPSRLPESIIEHSRHANVLLVDCLTLWISNLLFETGDSEKVLDRIGDLIQAIESADCPVVLVSNEVGTGIVPENKLARQYRDLAGAVNQTVAQHADKVVWMVAGIPVKIKG